MIFLRILCAFIVAQNETYSVLKWRRVTLDKSTMVNKEILEVKRSQQNNSKEASVWQTVSGWVDDSMAQTQVVLAEIQLDDNNANRMEEAPMFEYG